MDHDNSNPVLVPLDPVEMLQARATVAAVEDQQEADALRAVMSDEQVLDQFGVDLTQLDD